MTAAIVAKEIADDRSAGEQRLAGGRLAVQNAQRVQLIARFTGFAQRIIVVLQVSAERLLIFRAAVRTADAVEPNGESGKPRPLQQLQHNGDALRIRAGARRAENFHAELMVLAKAASLWPFVTEHRIV